MPPTAPQPTESAFAPILSSQAQGWDNILVEQFQPPAGEANCHFDNDHTIYLSLAPRPVHLLQVQAGKTHTGLYARGDLAITPAQTPFFARWQSHDHCLQIRIASRFLQTVAQASDLNSERLELVPEFQTRDPQLESIGQLLLSELQQGGSSPGGRLYVESLTNALAIHLLRHHVATTLRPVPYSGGLPKRQLLQVLDYIHDHLDQTIRLADLAQLLGMSQFHFSHGFKQSLGVAPYQYLLQQRIERAKQLLRQTDQPITDIALTCGFSSHSHLSKQFRQLTGFTPKAYRSH